MINVMKYANYHLDSFTREELDSLIEDLNRLRVENSKICSHCIMLLHNRQIYPVWNMPGHRNSFWFPTESDCEIWEEYIYQCADYE